MNRIPVCQFTLVFDAEGNEGLVFASELEQELNQSVVYAIPVEFGDNDLLDVWHTLETSEIYFPFLLKESYHELKAKVKFPELIFTVPETLEKIVFEADFDVSRLFMGAMRPFYPYRVRLRSYVGSFQEFAKKPNIGFLCLIPVDLNEMDEVYLTYGGIFVGLTPEIGKLSLE